MIPHLDAAPLFGPPSALRRSIDAAIGAAATEIGFLTLGNLPDLSALGAESRATILRIFDLPEDEAAKLDRQVTDSARPYAYRGRSRTGPRNATHHVSFEFGRDLAYDGTDSDLSDPLLWPSPMPPDSVLPGWRQAAGAYYRALERLGWALLGALARSLGLPESSMTAPFERGVSSLVLRHYPVRDGAALARVPEEELYVDDGGRRRMIVSEAHTDFGFITLLAQHGVDGLQVRDSRGTWIDLPPVENCVIVNFGQLFERWTGGRIRATEHRVLSPGRERYSIPFFLEPRVDAVIAPLPLADGDGFLPFVFGDHVWAALSAKRRGLLSRERSADFGVRIPSPLAGEG